jgi:hypothetical protein
MITPIRRKRNRAMRAYFKRFAFVLACVAVGGAPVTAAESAKSGAKAKVAVADLVAARQSAMLMSAANLGSIKALIDSGAGADKLSFPVAGLARWASAMTGLFPKGSASSNRVDRLGRLCRRGPEVQRRGQRLAGRGQGRRQGRHQHGIRRRSRCMQKLSRPVSGAAGTSPETGGLNYSLNRTVSRALRGAPVDMLLSLCATGK